MIGGARGESNIDKDGIYIPGNSQLNYTGSITKYDGNPITGRPINAQEAEEIDLSKVGMKYDGDKIRYELLPTASIEGIARILTFGAKKYADHNWKMVKPVERYYGALMRHLQAVKAGEWLDPESGLPHMDHVLCNAMFLRELEWNKETD